MLYPLHNSSGRNLKLRAKKLAPSLSDIETQLLETINKEIPKSLTKRFDELDKKRKAETLNSLEHEELIKLVKEIESINVGRMQALAELAGIRQISLGDLMKQLEIPSTGENG